MFDTVKSGWSIVYMEGIQVIIIFFFIVLLSLKIDLVLANSADPVEMPFNVAFQLGLLACKSTCLGVSDLQRFKSE